MGYSIIAFGVEGETVATLETVLADYAPAYALRAPWACPTTPRGGVWPGHPEFTEKNCTRGRPPWSSPERQGRLRPGHSPSSKTPSLMKKNRLVRHRDRVLLGGTMPRWARSPLDFRGDPRSHPSYLGIAGLSLQIVGLETLYNTIGETEMKAGKNVN
jgi:hypothetical protein